MASEDRSLRSLYDEAEQHKIALDNAFSSNTTEFQDKLRKTLELYEQCLVLADRISLFSPNEGVDDIATADLQYLLLKHRLGELVLRTTGTQRRDVLHQARDYFHGYLRQLDQYELLNKDEASMLEQYHESPDSFSISSSKDAALRRDTKIRHFREEKALKEQLANLRAHPRLHQNDDDVLRKLYLAEIAYNTHQTFNSLESIAQELHIISLAPLPQAPGESTQSWSDSRQRGVRANGAYSERLDPPLAQLAGLRGPLLDKDGKPLRPFTLTSRRQEVADGVFRPGHNLPTMSIDEYLEEERRRGGIIDGGGEKSGQRPMADEDDMEAADRETMKSREWDEFVEANPRGSGNTLNRG